MSTQPVRTPQSSLRESPVVHPLGFQSVISGFGCISQLQTPVPGPPSPLVALPEEIRAAIASHLTHADALSLRYTHSCFDKATELPLWRELDLSITQRYGEAPLTNPHLDDTREHEDFERRMLKEASKMYNDRLRRKLTATLARGDERRFGMTRRVRLVNREGPVHGLLQMLDSVSPTLQILDIEAPPEHIYERRTDHNYYHYLEYLMIDSGLFFPSLTHITLGDQAVWFSGFVPLLCSFAPNLDFLSMGEGHGEADGVLPREMEECFPHQKNTRIRHLRGIVDEPTDPISQLVPCSPLLIQLSVTAPRCSQEELAELVQSLQSHTCLREFHCNLPMADFEALTYTAKGDSLVSLHTVILEYGLWYDPWHHLPNPPNLRTIYLNRVRAPEPSGLGADAINTCRPSVAQGMVPTFALRMRNIHLRSLRTIDLSDYVDNGDSMVFSVLHKAEYESELIGVFRSICHKGNDAVLVHARLLLDKWEVDDKHRGRTTASDREQDSHFSYLTEDNVSRVKVFETLPRAVWQDFTDYDGAIVPLEIISRMYEVEGNGAAESDEQRVEVGDAAWKVLMDWEEAREMAQAS